MQTQYSIRNEESHSVILDLLRYMKHTDREHGRAAFPELVRNVLRLLRQGIPAGEISEKLGIFVEVVKGLME